MKPTILALATALALGLAGCDRTPEQRSTATTPPPAQTGTAATGSTSAAQSNTPSTPANVGKDAENPGTQPPVQGREDVRQPEQRKDFQQRGDGAGPKPGN